MTRGHFTTPHAYCEIRGNKLDSIYRHHNTTIEQRRGRQKHESVVGEGMRAACCHRRTCQIHADSRDGCRNLKPVEGTEPELHKNRGHDHSGVYGETLLDDDGTPTLRSCYYRMPNMAENGG